jgi:hypothetical protein
MLILKYIGKILSLGFKDFFNWSSATSGLASLALALYAGPRAPVSSLTTYDLALYVTYGLVFFVGIRVFLVAPYFAWQAEYFRAENLDMEVKKPAHLERVELARIRAGKKMELITAMREAHIAAIQRDEDACQKATHSIASVYPQAVSSDRMDTQIHDFVAACFLRIGAKHPNDGDLRAKFDAIVYAIHHE